MDCLLLWNSKMRFKKKYREYFRFGFKKTNCLFLLLLFLHLIWFFFFLQHRVMAVAEEGKKAWNLQFFVVVVKVLNMFSFLKLQKLVVSWIIMIWKSWKSSTVWMLLTMVVLFDSTELFLLEKNTSLYNCSQISCTYFWLFLFYFFLLFIFFGFFSNYLPSP